MLAELFWQDMPSSQSMKNLRTVLPNLRQLVGTHLIVTRQTITFNRESPYFLDIEPLQAIANHKQNDINLQFLSEAITQYQGDFLEGFYVPDALEFENWALMERERLRELALKGLDTLAEQCLVNQDYAAGLALTRKLLTLDPWRETAHQQQMLFLAQNGQRSAALSQYAVCRQILADEFDAEPMAETTALYEQIRMGHFCVPNAVVATPKDREGNLKFKIQNSSISPAIPAKFPNGPIPLDSPLYIDRPPTEQNARLQIQQPGGLVRIKAPRQMGKTSLILRILSDAATQGYQTVRLNLNQADEALLASPDRFLRWFCAVVTEQLALTHKLDDYWDLELGSKVSCTNYFRRYLLAQVQTPLVLILDELDRIFEHLETAQTFLPLLRFWYEEASDSAVWQNLRLVVAHSTELYVPLNLNQSPFNVGLPIKLREFDTAEIVALSQHYGLDEALARYPQSLAQLVDLVSGHPYLLNIAFHCLAQGNSLTQVLQTATDSTGIYGSHLRQHLVTLQTQPALAAALKTIVMADHPVPMQPLLAYKLESMGLTKTTGAGLILSCQLYRLYFRDCLSDQSTADALKSRSHRNSLHAIA